MDPEIIATLAVGVGLAGLILNGQRSMRPEIALLRQEVRTLGERVARLEGAFSVIAPRLGIAPSRDQTSGS